MTRRQAGTMLHPEAQASAEHRIKHRGAHRIHPMSPVVSASRQSGLQLSAQSQHHLGASFSLAHSHYTDIVTVPPNNLKPVSTFRGEDQMSLMTAWGLRLASLPTRRQSFIEASSEGYEITK